MVANEKNVDAEAAIPPAASAVPTVLISAVGSAPASASSCSTPTSAETISDTSTAETAPTPTPRSEKPSIEGTSSSSGSCSRKKLVT